MLSERQRDYRQEYRSRIDSWYNGPVHVFLIYAIGLTSLWLYTQHLENVRWWEWLSVPVFLLACNIFEWYLHLKIMHRPQKSKALRAIYNRHTLQHHQFFTDSEMRFRDQKDWRVTFFPPYALVVFILISIPGAVL
ncbi:MAG: fatty acid hydroxylase family protein, partial [SAR202 cluster bacterium]|nr:fatty acid hydroxylase family protein [SAR202 cluster bacterium]